MECIKRRFCRHAVIISSNDHKSSPLSPQGEACFTSLDPKVEPSSIF